MYAQEKEDTPVFYSLILLMTFNGGPSFSHTWYIFIFDLKVFKCLWMSQQIAFLQCQKVNSKSFYKSEKKYSQGWENGSQE